MDVRDPSFRSVGEDATLRRIVDTIVEALDPEQVILFGSRARGDEAAQSDYDICVVMEPGGRRRELVQQIHGLFGLRGFSIDAFVLVQRQPSFYGLNTRSQNSQITARHFERSREISLK